MPACGEHDCDWCGQFLLLSVSVHKPWPVVDTLSDTEFVVSSLRSITSSDGDHSLGLELSEVVTKTSGIDNTWWECIEPSSESLPEME